MNWKQALTELEAAYPQKCKLRKGADPLQIKQVQDTLKYSIDSVDPTWRDLLEFSNGMQILGYLFYSLEGQTINTITFKTLFLWEVNKLWQERMFLFMGTKKLLEFGILHDYLGEPCVAVITGSGGYEATEAIPIASNLSLFLDIFIMETQEVLESKKRVKARLPSLETWPPQLEKWYAHDGALVQRLSAAGLNTLHAENPRYAAQIVKACKTVTGGDNLS